VNGKGESRSRKERLEEVYNTFCEAWADGERPDLDDYCRDRPDLDPELRQNLEEFLFVAEGLQAGLDSDGSRRPAPPGKPEPLLGRRLGDFKVIREIGRGGMGVVFEAEQVSLNRSVALKVLPAHLTLRAESVERFKREASTASRLRHPGIVEIYSVGEEAENHFFAMELVDGTPLDRVINDLQKEDDFPVSGSRLIASISSGGRPRSASAARRTAEEDPDLSDKLAGVFKKRTYVETVCRLVLQVSDALDYAHEARVIHRDVKPSNILIRVDGTAVLTDFGLAREEGLPSLTVTGEFAGTPHYVSPEQAIPKGKKSDHRSDIYSLGVTLYELLTLRRPFEGKTSQEIFGKIVSREPQAPRFLNSLIPRDLETVCLAAMEKNPERRYQTAREFADDIERFLNFEPVQARPIGMLTRSFRLVRRNPAYSTLVALFLLVVVGGPLLFGIQQQKARLEIADALKESQRSEEKARREEATSRRVCDYVIGLFELPFPDEVTGRSATVFELLRAGASDVDTYLATRPDIQVRFKEAIGRVYTGLGLYEEAESVLEEARAVADRNMENGHSLIIGIDHKLADLYTRIGRHNAAEQLLEQILETRSRVLGPEDPATLGTMADLADAYLLAGKFARAEEHAWRVYEGRCSLWGNRHVDTLESLRTLSLLYAALGDYTKSADLFSDSYGWHCAELGEQHPDTLESLQYLAFSHFDNRRYDEAGRLYLQVLRGYCKALGQRHTKTVMACLLLAASLGHEGKKEDAKRYYQLALGVDVQLLGGYGKAWILMSRLIDHYIATGRLVEIEPVLKKIVDIVPENHHVYKKCKPALDEVLQRKKKGDRYGSEKR